VTLQSARRKTDEFSDPNERGKKNRAVAWGGGRKKKRKKGKNPIHLNLGEYRRRKGGQKKASVYFAPKKEGPALPSRSRLREKKKKEKKKVPGARRGFSSKKKRGGPFPEKDSPRKKKKTSAG